MRGIPLVFLRDVALNETDAYRSPLARERAVGDAPRCGGKRFGTARDVMIRTRVRVPALGEPSNFKVSPNTWYTLKARVDVSPDGSGVVRAKAWPRGETEPDKWTLEVPHKTAHQSGCPGLFGFAPQDQRVFIDNIVVTPNN